MSWFPDSIVNRPPRSDEFGLIVRPIFSGSDPGVLTVQLASGSINLSGSFSADPTRPATSNVTVVGYSTSTSVMAASNTDRRVLTIYNDSNRNLFLKLGPGASLIDWTVKMPPNAYYEVPQPCYTGNITGIWAAGGAGQARITELTP